MDKPRGYSQLSSQLLQRFEGAGVSEPKFAKRIIETIGLDLGHSNIVALILSGQHAVLGGVIGVVLG